MRCRCQTYIEQLGQNRKSICFLKCLACSLKQPRENIRYKRRIDFVPFVFNFNVFFSFSGPRKLETEMINISKCRCPNTNSVSTYLCWLQCFASGVFRLHSASFVTQRKTKLLPYCFLDIFYFRIQPTFSVAFYVAGWIFNSVCRRSFILIINSLQFLKAIV